MSSLGSVNLVLRFLFALKLLHFERLFFYIFLVVFVYRATLVQVNNFKASPVYISVYALNSPLQRTNLYTGFL